MATNDKIEMNTLSSILEKLRVKNMAHEFRLANDGFTVSGSKFYQPHDLKILRTYRFEGDSDPSDNAILYLIEASDGQLGYSIDAYGMYSDFGPGYDEFVRSIPVDERSEQQMFGS